MRTLFAAMGLVVGSALQQYSQNQDTYDDGMRSAVVVFMLVGLFTWAIIQDRKGRAPSE